MPRNIKNAGRPKKPVNLKQSFGRLFNYLKPFYNTILIVCQVFLLYLF